MLTRDVLGLDRQGDLDTEESFRYLTDDDWQLLMGKARRVAFSRDETLIEEGETTRRILMIAHGTVRIERHRAGQRQLLARLTAGQVLGEISFVDSLGAGASVVADGPTVVELVAGDQVDALLASSPGFAVRFYLSIASTLARRLRATSELLSGR